MLCGKGNNNVLGLTGTSKLMSITFLFQTAQFIQYLPFPPYDWNLICKLQPHAGSLFLVFAELFFTLPFSSYTYLSSVEISLIIGSKLGSSLSRVYNDLETTIESLFNH